MDFQQGINDGHLVIPAGNHQVSNLVPKQNTLIEAHPGAIITGSPIFKSTTAIRRVTIRGGIWKGAVWRHHGTSNMSHCFFEDMKISQAEVAFHIDTAIGLVFRDLWFTQCRTAWRMGGLGGSGGVINANRWVGCRVLNSNGVALDFTGNTTKPRRGNFVDGCWFESSDFSAIRAGAGTSHLVIQNTFFENTGPTNGSDIHLGSLGKDGAPPTAFIQGCYFNAPNPNQKGRVHARPGNRVLVQNCTAVVRNPPMRFIDGPATRRDNVSTLV